MAIKRNSDGKTASVVRQPDGASVGIRNPNPNTRSYPKSKDTSGGVKPNRVRAKRG